MSDFINEMVYAFDYAIHFYDGADYELLPFDNDTFRTVLLFMWFGAIFAFIAMYYNSCYLGGFVEKLILSGATTKENSKTLAELGCGKKLLLKYSLRSGSVLRKCVLGKDDPIPYSSDFYKGIGTPEENSDKFTETESPDDNEEIEEDSREVKKAKEDINSVAFYIPQQLQKKAQSRYRKRGNGIAFMILSIVVCAVIVFLAAIYGPLLLRFIDNTLVSLKGTDVIGR